MKYIIVLLFTFGMGNSLFGQSSFNLASYDERLLHYGFQVGVQMANFKIQKSRYFATNGDSTIAVNAQVSPGFSIGFILDAAIDEEYWNIRINPNVGFYTNNVIFHYRPDMDDDTPDVFTESVETAFFQLPILLKYKSLRRGNHRVYLVGGIVPSMKIGGKKLALDKTRLATQDFNLEITYGVGLDLYMSFFKFAPEVRFSHGIGNMVNRNGSSFEKNIERMTTHRFSILLNFE